MRQIEPEKRAYIRVGMAVSVSYKVVDAPREDKELIAKNISGGGMRLPLKEKLRVGTLLELQLELLKEKKGIQLEARVIWLKPTPDDRQHPYEAGIEFINIDFVKRNMISNCLQYLNREELLKEFFR